MQMCSYVALVSLNGLKWQSQVSSFECLNSVWQSIGYCQDVQNMALWPLGILDNILSSSQPQGKDALLKI